MIGAILKSVGEKNGIKDLKYENNVKLKQGFSKQIARKFKKESVDFVFIDGNHSYESVSEDLFTWFPKIKKGCFITGHDFNWPCVRRAVKEFVEKNPVRDFRHMGKEIWEMIKK